MSTATVLESSLTFTACQTQPLVASRRVTRPRLWTVFAVCVAAVVGGLMAYFAAHAAVAAWIAFMTALLGGNPSTILPLYEAAIEQSLMARLLLLVPFPAGAVVVVLFAWRSPKIL